MIKDIMKKLRQGEQLNQKELAVLSKEVEKNKKYGLVWEDHPEGVDLELKDGTFKITNFEDRAIRKLPGGRENLLMEGDNLHSLMALKEAGVEVDVIYIDPPYNTMNEEGFTYNDKKIDSNDNYRHSKWLSFMNKRLEIVRDLLTDEGVIFISIDDNEYANLKLLCDNIFGEKNLISNFIYKKTGQQQNNGTNVAITHEYILCYAKKLLDSNGKKRKLLIGDSILDRKGAKQYNNKDERGLYRLNPMQHRNVGKYKYTVFHPTTNKKVYSSYWVISENKYNELLKDNMIHWTENLPNVKKHLDPNQDVLINNYIDGFYNEQGDTQLKDILGLTDRFSNPKNKELIKYILKRFKSDVTILDFFAGSGTTGQAVMELNDEDGGNRRFILCTNNENNICEEITYERIRRVIEADYEKAKKPYPNNLTYLKVDIENKNNLSLKDKEFLDLDNKIKQTMIKEELMIEDENKIYITLKDREGNKHIFIKTNVIEDRSLNFEDAKTVRIPSHLFQEKIFQNFRNKITY